jgi:sugar transferase (PEP-CTERM/EpsH1 system associated)
MRNSPLIAHIIYELGTGGLENGLVNIINRMPQERYRHAIICLTSSGKFAQRLTREDIEIIELNKKPGLDWGVYWRMFKTLRRLRPAILHTRNLAALEMQAIRIFVPSARGVHGEHGRDIYDLDGSNRRYRMLRKLLQPLISTFVVVSEDLRNWLVQDVGVPSGKVKQIYNGVDQSRFKPGVNVRPAILPAQFSGADYTVLGTVGRLAEVKDQSSLMSALSLLLRKKPELTDSVKLFIIGDGPCRDTLEDQIQAAGLQENVWLSGDREDIPELLRSFDVFVLPSLGEGISNTILEAMATGLPIIATRVGGNPELVGDGVNGRLVGAGQQQELADRMLEMIVDVPYREQCGERSLEKVRQSFSWDATVSAYCSVYDRLLGQSEGIAA